MPIIIIIIKILITITNKFEITIIISKTLTLPSNHILINNKESIKPKA